MDSFLPEVQEILNIFLFPKGNVTDRKMFGGLCCMVNGKMFTLIFYNALVTELTDDVRAEAFQSAGAKPFEHTHSPFGQWDMFHCDDPQQVKELQPWLELAYSYVSSTPLAHNHRRRQR